MYLARCKIIHAEQRPSVKVDIIFTYSKLVREYWIPWLVARLQTGRGIRLQVNRFIIRQISENFEDRSSSSKYCRFRSFSVVIAFCRDLIRIPTYTNTRTKANTRYSKIGGYIVDAAPGQNLHGNPGNFCREKRQLLAQQLLIQLPGFRHYVARCWYLVEFMVRFLSFAPYFPILWMLHRYVVFSAFVSRFGIRLFRAFSLIFVQRYGT